MSGKLWTLEFKVDGSLIATNHGTSILWSIMQLLEERSSLFRLLNLEGCPWSLAGAALLGEQPADPPRVPAVSPEGRKSSRQSRLLASVSCGHREAGTAGGPRGKRGMSWRLFCVIRRGGFTDCGEHALVLSVWENSLLNWIKGRLGRKEREKNKRPKWGERERDRLTELSQKLLLAKGGHCQEPFCFARMPCLEGFRLF